MAWQELFGSDVGLLSLCVILFMLGMAVFFVRLFVKKMNTEVPAAPPAAAPPAPGGGARRQA